MKQLLRLKPWMQLVPFDADDIGLLSETATQIFKGALLAALLPLLDGTRDEDEIAAALQDRFDLATIYYHIGQLKRKRLIEIAPAQEPSPALVFYERLNGDGALLAPRRRVVVTAVGGMIPQPFAERLSHYESLQVECLDRQPVAADAESLWIVLTPGYLEPALAEFNRQALAANVPWLPCKPDGLEPCIGPLLIPGATACFACLLHRLRGHRVSENLVIRKTGNAPRLAQGRTHASWDIVCGLLGLELEKVFAHSPHARLSKGVVSLDVASLRISCHELTKRARCPVCGEQLNRRLSKLPETDFRLSPQPKADYNDGGQRIKAAADTMRQFETRISPITGEVGSLTVNDGAPAFFGHSVISTWVLHNGFKGEARRGRFLAVGSSSGKGRSEMQANASALGEALERYCSQSFGEEPYLRAAWPDIKDQAIHPNALNSFSEHQYEHREEWAQRAETGRVPERFDEASPIDWTPAWSLTRQAWRWIPSAYMYYQYREESGHVFAHGDSNGVAAGNCIEEAIIQGFMELVERDGVALWWYNKLQRPALDLTTFGSAFALEAAEQIRRYQYRLHVLDLTSDLKLPTFAAVARHESDPDGEPLLGFGAHFDPRIALDRAISEMGQSWTLKERIHANTICRNVTGRSLASEPFMRPPDDAPLTPFSAFTNLAADDFLKDIETCVAILKGVGLEMLAADLTRPEVGLAVARVIVPGLVHFWPRFGATRLYDVPVKMGWLPRPLTEEELYPVPFYF